MYKHLKNQLELCFIGNLHYTECGKCALHISSDKHETVNFYFRIHVLTIQVQLGGKYSKDYLDLTYGTHL